MTGCIEWPAQRYPDPPVPAGATYPTMPVLVLDGDLDLITPLGDSAQAAGLFPEFDLRGGAQRRHVTALADYPGCAAGIVRRFLRTLSTGDVSCVRRTPEIHVVPKFPRRVAKAPAARSAGGADRSRPLGSPGGLVCGVGPRRRARALVADVRYRGPRPARRQLHGLGDYLAYAPVRFS